MAPDPKVSNLSLVVDAEMDASGHQVSVTRSSKEVQPSQGAESILRAIEALVRGLAESLGEAGTKTTISLGSFQIDFSSPGWGDDRVRVYRTSDGSSPDLDDSSTAWQDSGRMEHTGDTWEQGISAAREGDHAQALELFENEAAYAAESQLHQRAAIAYRSASREADRLGREDHANKLLRLSGKHYLFVAESPHTPSRSVVQAFVTAAKCFLQAGNLPLAQASITRALATSETLSEIA